MNTAIRLGTRGSRLALTQTETVAALLKTTCGVDTEIVVIRTTGDREQNLDPGTPSWSPGAFTKELESALLDDRVDLAIHSFKDMGTLETPGLEIPSVLERAPVHDVLVCRDEATADAIRAALADDDVHAGLVIGTSSPRRSAQVRAAIGAEVRAIRGNVPTRVGKVTDGVNGYDAVMLAAAGLGRLGMEPEHTVTLPIDRFPSAAGQGAIAIQGRADCEASRTAAALDHEATRRATTAERAFLRRIDAGCHTAAAATAVASPNGRVRLHTQYFDDDGRDLDHVAEGTEPRTVGESAGDVVLQWLRTTISSG